MAVTMRPSRRSRVKARTMVSRLTWSPQRSLGRHAHASPQLTMDDLGPEGCRHMVGE